MTAGERLHHLAGISGSAAALLLAIGSGATAGAALVNHSGLASGTAADHLMVDRVMAGMGAYLPPAGKPPRFRPEPFVPAHIPYELLDRRRDDEDAFLLGVLL